MGRYGGYEGFKQWSNQKSVVEKWQLNMWPITIVCPPWTNSRTSLMNVLLKALVIKQNAVFYGILKIAIGTLIGLLIFSDIGQCQFRRDVARDLGHFILSYAVTY